MKKIASLFILVSMIFGLISCGVKEGTNEDIETDDGTSPEVIDMDGYEFIFYALTDFETFFFPEAVSSAYGDKILDRYKETGNKFNAEINVSAVTSTDMHKTGINKAAATGDKYADLVDTTARQIYESREAYLALNDLEEIDITSNKWGPASYLETTKFDGYNYGFIAYYWGMPYPQYIGNLYFMKAVVVDEFNLRNPQELYEQKEWYWDNFKEYSKSMTVVDPADSANNRYGFVLSNEMKMPRAFIISNGSSPIKHDESTGLYSSGMDDPAVTEALLYLKGMLDEGIGLFTTGDAWEKAARMFKEKKTGFYEAYNKHTFVNAELHLASDLGEEYSWLPYPCGPKGTYGTSTAQFWHTARFLAMPDIGDSGATEYNAMIIEDLFRPLEGETETSWTQRIQDNYFFDDLSFKYYIDLFEGGHTDYSTICYNSLWTHMPAIYNAVFSGRSTVPEAVQKNNDKIQAEIDKLLNNINAES